MVENQELLFVDLTEKEQATLNFTRIYFSRKKVPEIYYCIGNISEMTYCIIKENNVWKTFYYESGHKHFKKEFDDVVSACINLVGKFEENLNKEELLMFEQQIKQLENNYSKGIQKIKKIDKRTT